MKKLLSVVLFVCIIMSISTNTFANLQDKQLFTDVPETHWAFPYISDMVERGVLNGYEDGTFRPDNPVTRAEAAKMLATIEYGAIKGSGTSRGSFYDVPEDSWYGNYAQICYHYFNHYEVKEKGKTVKCFYPNDYAEREDIIVALICQLDDLGLHVAADKVIVEKADQNSWDYDSGERAYVLSRTEIEYETYSDYSTATASKLPYIERAFSIGMVTGYSDNTLRPHAPVTRAEMATLLYKLYGDRNAKDIIAGIKNYKIDCTIDEFVSRYNQNVKENAKKIEYDKYDNFIIENLYINKIMISKTGKNGDSTQTSYGNFRGESAFFVDNATNKIIRVNWDINPLRFYDTKIQGERIQDFDNICFLMAMLNITYDEAKDLLYVIQNCPMFSRSGDVIFVKDRGILCGEDYYKLSLVDLRFLEDFDCGIYPDKKNSGIDITTTNDKITEFVSKYNANILENFKYLRIDLRNISPENILLSENGFASKSTSSEDIFRYSVEYGSDLYGYTEGNLSIICNTRNEILSITLSPTNIKGDSTNTNSDLINLSNFEGICLIQALEDISYEDAKRYYFSIMKGKGLTSAKGNIYSNPRAFEISITAGEYYSYLQDLSVRYQESLLE